MSNFRFFDLPGEMRNAIYEDCMAHDRSRGLTANTALLRTNKQVHEEAAWLIERYGVFTIYVRATLSAFIIHDEWETMCELRTGGDLPRRVFGEWDDCTTMTIEAFYDFLPRELLRVRKVTVHLVLDSGDLAETGQPVEYEPLDRFLYAVSNLLNSDAHRREVVLTVDGTNEIGHLQDAVPRRWARKLHPRNVIDVSSIGDDMPVDHPETLRQYIDHRLGPPGFTDCADYIGIHQRLLAGFHRLYRKRRDTKPQLVMKSFRDALSVISKYSREDTGALSSAGFLDVVLERNLAKLHRMTREDMQELRYCFDQPDGEPTLVLNERAGLRTDDGA